MNEPLPRNPASGLGDASYRQQLLERIESLLSVLEVAHNRLRMHADRPGAVSARQRQTLKSLAGTIQICHRARRALEREQAWEDGLGDDAPFLGPEAAAASSFAEYLRFRDLGPLTRAELEQADVDSISERLGQEEAGEA